MSVADDIFLEIAKAKTTQGGNYIRDGRYVLAVENLLLEEKHGKKVWFIAELLVLKSERVDVPLHMRNEGEKELDLSPTPVGERVSFLAPMGEDWGPGKAKAFLCALNGTDPKEVAGDEGVAKFVSILKASVSRAQVLRGALVKLDTYRKQTRMGKNPGSWGIRENWQTVPDQTAESIRELRTKIDAGESFAA